MRAAQRRWRKLIDSQPPEKEVQKFMERNPAFVPGPDGMGDGAHGPLGSLLYSQPPLPGIASRTPDFMWISKNSGELIPVLLEIEAPRKRWYTRDGRQHFHLTQATGQIAEWRRWFDNPANRDNFYDLYELGPRERRLAFRPKFVLIYGRAAEFEGDPDRGALRSYLNPPERSTYMTYDRVAPHWYATDAIVVRLSLRTRRARAVAIPPTFGFDVWGSEAIGRLTGLERAIENMEGVGAKRKKFLAGRLAYWRDQAERGIDEVRSMGDR